jgi:hypothetical protein
MLSLELFSILFIVSGNLGRHGKEKSRGIQLPKIQRS